ncbi:hypothetical protein BH10ACI4_BH10ACI4_05660 [soil metagenome]
MKLTAALFFLTTLFHSPQVIPIPSFSGSWTLDLHRSTFEGKPHPPIAGEIVIRYDGTHWHRWRSYTSPNGKVDARAVDLIVDEPKPLVVKNASDTSYTTMRREGEALVLRQDFVSNAGEKASNTVRYTLEDHGNTLVESEHEETPAGNETNRWVSIRKKE